MKNKLLKGTVIGLITALSLSMVACGSPKKATTKKSDSTSTNKQSKQGDDESIDGLLTSFDTSQVAKPGLLYDKNNVQVTLDSMEYKNDNVVLGVTFQNNSDKALNVGMNSAYTTVNGFTIGGLGGFSNIDPIQPGEKYSSNIYMEKSMLQMFGINSIAKIGINFLVTSESDDDNTRFITDMMWITTPLDATYDYSKDFFPEAMKDVTMKAKYGISAKGFTENTTFEAGGVNSLNQVVITKKDGDKILLVEVENTTDQILLLQTADIRLNDSDAVYKYNFSRDYIAPQSKGCISIDLEGLLEKDEFDGIDSISKFDCTVSVEDRDYNELTSGTLSADGINYKKGNK